MSNEQYLGWTLFILEESTKISKSRRGGGGHYYRFILGHIVQEPNVEVLLCWARLNDLHYNIYHVSFFEVVTYDFVFTSSLW